MLCYKHLQVQVVTQRYYKQTLCKKNLGTYNLFMCVGDVRILAFL